jgi:predicted HicB family RNase H-like nuclease
MRVYITDELMEKLKELAIEEDISLEELIHKILTHAITNKKSM